MYGHVETVEERLDHVFTIREIQKETGGFSELIPMSFLPYNNRIGEKMLASGKFASTGLEDLQLIAISRIILHTYVNNIQATWVKLGKKLAQVALQCGANDLGGTLMEDQISTASGGSHGEYVSPAEFEWMIKGAGRIPMQRDTLYRKVEPRFPDREGATSELRKDQNRQQGIRTIKIEDLISGRLKDHYLQESR